MTAAVVIQAEPEWLIRPYDAALDEDGLHYLLGVSYTRTRAGQRAGASRAGRPMPGLRDEDMVARQRAFLEAHRPVWTWLLTHAETSLLVDPDAPGIVWGWLVTSGDDVLHACGVKRSIIEQGLGPDVVRALLGGRLERHQVCTLELPQMRTRGPDAAGVDRPRTWSLDPTWLGVRGAFA